MAIIGAGPAGLCAARHFFAPGSGFTGCLYEQAGDLGGTWLYSDVTGKDRFGLPVHSTLYYDLWLEFIIFFIFKFTVCPKKFHPSLGAKIKDANLCKLQ